MLEKAMRLCEAAFGVLWTSDGDSFGAAAFRGVPPEYAEFVAEQRRRPEPDTALGELAVGREFVQIADVTKRPTGDEMVRRLVELGSVRTLLVVPLRKDGGLLGSIHIFRQEVRPFTEKQIALLQNFAAQAVIAMENARLINETREALEQQTATSEVLQVINSSPGNLTPVFDAILEKAHSLCDIAQGSLELYDGEWFRAVAVRGLSDEFAEILQQGCPAADNPATQPLIEGRRFAHILDLAETDYTVTRSAAELAAARTLLCVPLRREGVLLGMIASARREVRPFSDKEITLLENFAAQAVIAMENARLISETRDALEQQTATAEVLGVINSSPGDLAPVFEAMLDKAMRLCGFDHGSLQTYDGQLFRAVAVRGLPEQLAEELRRGYRPELWPPTRPLVDGARLVHVPDLTQEEQVEGVRLAVASGSRTLLFIPLRKNDALLGTIVAVRQEVRPFAEKEIALLQNFAAQAVIAMENARLITETREALDQQTATAEVLQVINSSPGDLAPVFNAILKNAMSRCEAAFGFMTTYNGERFAPAAMRDVPEALTSYFAQGMDQPQPGEAHWRLLQGEDFIHNLDQKDEEAYRSGSPLRRAVVDL